MTTNKLIKFLMVPAVMASLSMPAQAVPITGQIDLSGTATADSSDFLTAHEFESFTGVTVGGAPSGTYAGVADSQAVSMPNPVVFAPTPLPVSPLWTFTIGTTTYDFNLTSLTVAPGTTANSIQLDGSGTLQVTGYDDTPGTWILNASTFGSDTFTFESSNAAAGVPDGGTTVLLLGVSLTSLALIRRRLA
jgi:hypothetical protein